MGLLDIFRRDTAAARELAELRAETDRLTKLIREDAHRVDAYGQPPGLSLEGALTGRPSGPMRLGEAFELAPELVDNLYEFFPLVRTAVDLTADFGTAKGADIEGLDGEDVVAVEDALAGLEVDDTIGECWKSSRKTGGGGIVAVVRDGRPPWEPVNWDALVEVREFLALDRHELLVEEYAEDPMSAQPGRPRLWNAEGVTTHWTRVWAQPFLQLPRRRRLVYNWWSPGLVSQLWNSLWGDDQARAALLDLLAEFGFDIIKVHGIETKDRKAVKKALENIRVCLQKYRRIALGPNDDIVTRSRAISGIPEGVEHLAKVIARDSRIPASILLWETPGGLNTGANAGDWEAWYGQVAGEQRTFYTPPATWCRRFVLESIRGPLKSRGKLPPPRWKVTPRKLGQLSEEKMADVRLKNAQARQADVMSQVIDPAEARREPTLIELYSLDTELGPDELDVDLNENDPVEPELAPPPAPEEAEDDAEPEVLTGMPPAGHTLMSAGAIGARFGFSAASIRGLHRAGRVQAWRVSARGPLRMSMEQVASALAGQ